MPKILLVEDDTNLAFMIADGMEGEGFEIKTFDSGEEALPIFIEFKPDIVVTDVNLKGMMDGFELARQVRNLSDTPVIFITARTQLNDLKKGYAIGHVDYLKKPFGINELYLRTNELLSRVKTTPSPGRATLIGSYAFSPAEQLLHFGSQKIHLNPTETRVLDILNQNRNNVVSRLEISNAFADTARASQNRADQKSKLEKRNTLSFNEGTFYNAIVSLREKLSKDSSIRIEPVSKTGYKLSVTR